MKKTVIEGEKHFTSSVWIITSGIPKKMLLINHKKLKRWMQPGGHIEQFENPVDAAVREVREETGLDISFLLSQIQVVDEEGSFLPTPKFLIEQTIPAREDAPMHYHIDINYVVEIPEQKLQHNEKEAHDIAWFTKEEISRLSTHADTKVIVERLM